MFWKAVCDNLGTIIGVIGSLVGGVIGWWLNNLSRRGKITIFTKNGINGEFRTKDDFPATSLNESDSFYYKSNIQICNSSSDTKILRDIEIVFFNGNKELFSTVPYDKDLQVFIDKKLPLPPVHKHIQLLNIPAKYAVSLQIYGRIEQNHLEEVFNATSVNLRYKDEKDKQHSKLIEERIYKQYEFYQGE